MDRQEGDDELPRAPEIASVDAGKPGCRRPLPARIRRIGPGRGRL